jgi:AraC family transcriptional regulator
MFDYQSSVLQIANKCGFSSVSSFSRAFKSIFGMSPGEWRKHDYHGADKPYLADPEIAAGYSRVAQVGIPEPTILTISEKHAAYVRHQGYNRSIKRAWLILKAWAEAENRSFDTQFGLHHSNPALVALEKCRYVACIEIDKPLNYRGVVNQLTIPGGLHAIFRLEGVYGELLPQISHVLEQWLPKSGFKLGSTPAYVQYQNNHFLSADEKFVLDFYLPIGFY